MRELSVLKDDRLVARVTDQAGTLRRAGARGDKALREVPFADVVVYDATTERWLSEVLGRVSDLDALLFEIGLNDCRVIEGVAAPNARTRRY